MLSFPIICLGMEVGERMERDRGGDRRGIEGEIGEDGKGVIF